MMIFDNTMSDSEADDEAERLYDGCGLCKMSCSQQESRDNHENQVGRLRIPE